MAIKKRFTGSEDRKRCEIIGKLKRVNWSDVVEQLKEAGFPPRSVGSVRNRHIRIQKAIDGKGESKNQCRKCGLPQRGHVCGGVISE